MGFDVAIFTPASGGPFPTIINPSFFNTPGVGLTNNSADADDKSTCGSGDQFTGTSAFQFQCAG